MQSYGTRHVLVVADRTADPMTVIDAVRERARETRVTASVLVPATLHGLEWVGDPRATIPAAERHAALLQTALLNAGVARCEAGVGDPDPHAAIDDALRVESFDEVLISVRSPRLATALHVGLAVRVAPEVRAQVNYLRSRRAHRLPALAGT